MAVINGTDFTIYIPTAPESTDSATTTWEPIGLSKSCSLSISVDTPDSSTKDSSGWSEVIAGQKSWSVDFEGLVDFTLTGTASPNVDQLFQYMIDRSKILVAIGTNAAESNEDHYFYGSGYITSLEQSAEMEQPVSFSGSITGTSTLSMGTSTDVGASAEYPEA